MHSITPDANRLKFTQFYGLGAFELLIAYFTFSLAHYMSRLYWSGVLPVQRLKARAKLARLR